MALDFSTAVLEMKDMENGFKILRKKYFQPRILNLAKQSRKCENNIFRHVRSHKGDSCRAGIIINKPTWSRSEAPRRNFSKKRKLTLRFAGIERRFTQLGRG